MTYMSDPFPKKFDPGTVALSRGVAEWIDPGEIYYYLMADLMRLLQRHLSCDWGEVDSQDWKENDLSVQRGYRILSAYRLHERRLWIITEGDRSVTTILFPEEY